MFLVFFFVVFIVNLIFLISMFPLQVPLTKATQVEVLEIQPSGAKSLNNLGNQCNSAIVQCLAKYWPLVMHWL